jgi:hypothetical protein
MAENQGNETGKGAKRQRRQFSAVEKRRLLDETEKPGESVSTVARRYQPEPEHACLAQGDGGRCRD